MVGGELMYRRLGTTRRKPVEAGWVDEACVDGGPYAQWRLLLTREGSKVHDDADDDDETMMRRS